jgi:hypothetical protein
MPLTTIPLVMATNPRSLPTSKYTQRCDYLTYQHMMDTPADTWALGQIKVMQQLTQWAMIHPERIRDKMDEQRDTEQTDWVGHDYPLPSTPTDKFI